MASTITVKHNMEVAHRLSQTPGKCEAIHGHSMWVVLTLYGEINRQGLLEGIEFGVLKKDFRLYLDNAFDHHLILCAGDPLVAALSGKELERYYPGLRMMDQDPTTENLARSIGQLYHDKYKLPVTCEVQETSVNSSTWHSAGGWL